MHFPHMEIDREIWRAGLKAAGGVDALAEKLGIKRRTVFMWRLGGVPAERVADVAAVMGIPATQIRPDLAAVFAAHHTPAELDREEMAHDEADVLVERGIA